jgi:hypothetical protein
MSVEPFSPSRLTLELLAWKCTAKRKWRAVEQFGRRLLQYNSPPTLHEMPISDNAIEALLFS